jgi:hypothetical protein
LRNNVIGGNVRPHAELVSTPLIAPDPRYSGHKCGGDEGADEQRDFTTQCDALRLKESANEKGMRRGREFGATDIARAVERGERKPAVSSAPRCVAFTP